MNRERKSLIVIYAVSVAVFLTVFFAIPFNLIAASWAAFAFGVVSIIVGLCVSIYATKDGNNLKSKLYGFPMFRLGYYYTIAQVVVSLVIIVIASMFEMPTWIPVVVGVILLAVVVAGTVAVDNAREYIVQQESSVSLNTSTMDYLKVQVQNLVSKCKDSETRNKVEGLSEIIKYSDPVSSSQTVEIEEKIAKQISNLELMMNKGTYEEGSIEEIKDLLNERNGICKVSK